MDVRLRTYLFQTIDLPLFKFLITRCTGRGHDAVWGAGMTMDDSLENQRSLLLKGGAHRCSAPHILAACAYLQSLGRSLSLVTSCTSFSHYMI